jgi:hypothetical protein
MMASTVSNTIKHQHLKALTNCKENGRHSEQQNQTLIPQNTHQLEKGWQAQSATESNIKTSKHSHPAKMMASTVSNRIKHQDLKILTLCKEDGRHSDQQNQTSRPQNTHRLQREWQAQ